MCCAEQKGKMAFLQVLEIVERGVLFVGSIAFREAVVQLDF